MADHNTDQEPAAVGPFKDVPIPIVELCQALSDFVHRSVGIRPDFTPDTLPLVDHYAQEVRASIAERPELLDLAAQAVGAYFGEVVRRHLSGFWRIPTPNFHDWQLCGDVAFVGINPIGVGYEAVAEGMDHSGPSAALKLAPEDRELVEAKLAAMPPVTDEEYRSLSTRYDVLEMVMETVRAQTEARGYSEMQYTGEDYDTELRPLGMD